jgi:hypothetical protein
LSQREFGNGILEADSSWFLDVISHFHQQLGPAGWGQLLVLTPVGVEKVRDWNDLWVVIVATSSFFL